MAGDRIEFELGQRVTVTQQVQNKGWATRVTGVVESFAQRKTGSWFAHAKDDKLWLDRLTLRKDDGEIVVCNLDRYTRVEVVDGSTSRAEGVSANGAEADGGRGGGS